MNKEIRKLLYPNVYTIDDHPAEMDELFDDSFRIKFLEKPALNKKNNGMYEQILCLRLASFLGEYGSVLPPTPPGKNQSGRWLLDKWDLYSDFICVSRNNLMMAAYRIMNRQDAERAGGFLSESEFDISKIKKARGNIAELSQACVHPEFRGSPAMRLVWNGIFDYFLRNEICIFMGLPSFHGTDYKKYSHALSYIYQTHMLPDHMQPKMLPGATSANINILPPERIDKKAARIEMPPIFKLYIGMSGGKGCFSNSIFMDPNSNTSDLFAALEVRNISSAYQNHYLGRPDAFAHLIPEYS
jgi:putative hemolysin